MLGEAKKGRRMLYAPQLSSATAITGRAVAHGKRTARQRAILAADLVSGRVILTPWTITQATVVCGVSYPLIAAALGRGETLAQHFARCSEAELLAAAREIGVDRVWDEMIAPTLP
jgi:hypothetical protein